MWYNNKTKELQNNPPYSGFIREDLIQGLYPDWIEVEDNFTIEKTPEELQKKALASLDTDYKQTMESLTHALAKATLAKDLNKITALENLYLSQKDKYIEERMSIINGNS